MQMETDKYDQGCTCQKCTKEHIKSNNNCKPRHRCHKHKKKCPTGPTGPNGPDGLNGSTGPTGQDGLGGSTGPTGTLEFFTSSVYTGCINPVYVLDPLPLSEVNVDIVINTRGTGALMRTVPDGGIFGGDCRGEYATDLQTSRINSNQVASGLGAAIGGGHSNAASGDYSGVCSGHSNAVSGDYSGVCSGSNNDVSGNLSGVCSGGRNGVSGDYSCVCGGIRNNVSGNFSGVYSGSGNNVGGDYSGVGSGRDNRVSGSHSGVGSGSGNTVDVDASHSGVCSGLNNVVIGSYSGVGSGRENNVSGDNSGVSSGVGNVVDGRNSGVGSGRGNNVGGNYSGVGSGFSNNVSGDLSGVSSGLSNVVIGDYSGVDSGLSNIVRGNYSGVGSGKENTVHGDYSGIGSGSNNTVHADASYSGVCSGLDNVVIGSYSGVGSGLGILLEDDYSFAVGKYNKPSILTEGGSDTRIFMVGYGKPASRTNLFSVTSDGNAHISNVMYTTGGADFAEFFESADKKCIPLGTAVMFDTNTNKILPSNNPLKTIGVISNTGAFIGNSGSEEWTKKYDRDDDGNFIWETYTKDKMVDVTEKITQNIVQEDTDYTMDPPRTVRKIITRTIDRPVMVESTVYDDEGNEIKRIKVHKKVKVTTENKRRKISPNYDSSMTYVPRQARPEWNIVGLIGMVKVLKGQPLQKSSHIVTVGDKYDLVLLK